MISPYGLPYDRHSSANNPGWMFWAKQSATALRNRKCYIRQDLQCLRICCGNVDHAQQSWSSTLRTGRSSALSIYLTTTKDTMNFLMITVSKWNFIWYGTSSWMLWWKQFKVFETKDGPYGQTHSPSRYVSEICCSCFLYCTISQYSLYSD